MVMAPMVAGLSDADIENLAAYYASLDPSGK
jgi:cytochrome c553